MTRLLRLCLVACFAVGGCAFQGVNSLPLPGAVGRGPHANVYHVEIANIGTLESNSPVMMADVIVGSVGKMRVKGDHADVEVSVKPDVVVPGNAVAAVGQTSLLGSMHVELNPPLGQPARGRLQSGATIPLDRSSSYPSTEQTLSALSVVLNSGGLGQIGDIVHNFSAGLSGHENDIRQLLTRLDEFVGVLDQQRDRIMASIDSLNRLAGTFASQREVITQALRKIPPALDVLIRERPRIVAALDKLRIFSNTATRLVNDTQADLVKNLQNLEPTIQALAEVGPDLSTVLGYVPTFPFTQNFIDRAVRGDYFNVFAVIDMTIPRLKRTLLAGTRWGDPDAPLVPAPGDPWYGNYTYDPLGFAVAPPVAPGGPPSGAPPPPVAAAPDLSAIAPVDQPTRGGG
ncbi:MCE family protein [Mycobacterium marseillense]|uniref:MCE family protein n=1 Tax=Mycobacterium marseillense TaxID=701042 RepID=UPI0011AA291D|nr:MCE family protein [Mycobacterium marseillense]